VGCLLAELHLGYPLFYKCDYLEHLAVMERTLGTFPARFALDIKHKRPGIFRQNDPAIVNFPTLVPDGEPIPDQVRIARERMRLLRNINVSFIVRLH
jgi:hypothetical protein